MTILGLIAAYITLLLAGAGVALILLSRRPRVNVVECICLAWLFGVGTVSLLLWIFGNFVSGIALQFLVTATAVALAFAGWRSTRRSQTSLYVPRPANLWEWSLVVLLVIQIATIFCASSKHTLGWDGLLVWEIKARYAFLNGGVLPAAYFKEGGLAFSHSDYPLALPFTELWLYLWMGEANQFWVKTIFPVFYAVGATLLVLLGSRLTGNRLLGCVLGILIYFVPQVTVMAGSVIVGYVDFPLAVFYLATVGYLLYSLTQKPAAAGSFSVFTTCLLFLPWIKREGSVLWVVAVLAGIVVIFAQRRSWRAWLALSPGLVLMLAWKIFLRTMNVAPSFEFLSLDITTLRANLGRLVPIYGALFKEVAAVSSWGIFWLLTATAFVYLLWGWRRLPYLLMLGTTLLPIFLYSLTYLFSAWPQYLDHVSTSLPRLLMQVVPVAWLSIGAAFAGCLLANRRVATRPSS
jgi:hypothetical protein